MPLLVAARRWIIASAALCVLPGVADDALRIIELKHRTAAEVAPLVRPLLGPHDALSATDYRLIVRAPPSTVAELERVVRQLDVARRQLTITVRHVHSGRHRHSTHGISGDAQIGEHGNVRLPRPAPGNETVVIGEPDGVQYRGGESRSTASQAQTQRLRVQDGARAYLRMGQSVPHVQRVLALAGNRAVAFDSVTLRDATTGFDVRPHVRGDRVQLDITPRIARLSDSRQGIIDLGEAATTVSVKLGEWVDLGEIVSNSASVSRAILSRDADQSGEQWRVLLKVD